MGPEITPTPPPPPPLAPPPTRRLRRSSRERMWAGVAGGMAEYFDLDPSLVRLIWVAAAVVSHGLAIPLYILAWIILPRDDRPSSDPSTQAHWRDWSQEFHAETQRLAQEARRVASEFQSPPPTSESTPSPTLESQPATEKKPAAAAGEPWTATATSTSEPASTWSAPAEPASTWSAPGEPAPTWSAPHAEPTPTWQPTDLDEPRRNGGHPRTVGVALVGLGAFLLAANAGWFAWFNWSSMWPLIFIGLGIVLLARQFNWWDR